MRTFSCSSFFSTKRRDGKIVTIAAIIVALLFISAAIFISKNSSTVEAAGSSQNNNNGNNGAQQLGGNRCPTGMKRCHDPGFLCFDGTVCVDGGPGVPLGCGTCQGVVVNPGGCENTDLGCPPPSCDYGYCPNNPYQCRAFPGDNCVAPFNFTISSDHSVSAPLAVAWRDNGNVLITLGLIGSPTQPVTLTSQILTKIGAGYFAQTDLTRAFSQTTCSPNCTSTMVVTANTLGNYVVRVTGTAGTIVHSTDVYIIVSDPTPPDCSPDSSPNAKPLCGFAWGATDEGPLSENGVGWLSFNSEDCDKDHDGMSDTNISGCPAVATVVPQYKVTVSSDGTLKGCAWSPNVGWVKFNNLSGFPSYAGNSQRDARLASGSNATTQSTTLEGWARACAGTTSGDCGTMNDHASGWDGWISLKNSGIANATVTYLNGVFSGNAWGSDVVGWLGFNTGNSSAVRLCSVQLFDFDLTSNDTITIAQGTTGQLPVTVTKIGSAVSELVTLSSSLVSAPSAGTIGRSFVPVSGTPNPSYSSDLSISVSSNVPVGTYTLNLTGSSPSIVRNKNVTVQVTPGSASGLLNVQCTPPLGGVGEVNKPVVYGVTVSGAGTPPSTPTPAFDFRITTSDTPPVVVSGQSSANPLTGVSKVFSTIGRKTVTIKVTDHSSTPASGECTVDVLVRVKPEIKEQ